MIYQFPLRPGCSVSLELPLDITHQDVDRLERFMRSLPFEAREEEPASDAEPEADAEGGDAQEEEASDEDEDPDLAGVEDGESDDLAEDEEESEEEAPPRRSPKAHLAKEPADAKITDLRQSLRTLCEFAPAPRQHGPGRPAAAPALLYEAVVCKALLGAAARVVTSSVVAGIHYNTLIRAFHAPATASAVRAMYLVADAALQRARGQATVHLRDLSLQPTLTNEERIEAYAVGIARVLRSAAEARVDLRFEPLPAAEPGPAVPKGTTFEAALRADPTLAAKIRR
ncbi:MAG: hypothetical protein E6Q97_20145 [Desulfurellales bacterium]|nr:MAG: hypothetical protein E6Q97_20145 [Desulfurellales bacterium]